MKEIEKVIQELQFLDKLESTIEKIWKLETLSTKLKHYADTMRMELNSVDLENK